MRRNFLSAYAGFRLILYFCLLTGLAGCSLGAKTSDKTGAQVNGEGISGGGDVEDFAKKSFNLATETLRLIQRAGPDITLIEPFPLCPDRHASCVNANELSDTQLRLVSQYLQKAVFDMINLHDYSPALMRSSSTRPTAKGADGREIERNVVARWGDAQEIVYDYEWLKQLIKDKSRNEAMRILMQELGRELTRLVVVDGARLLDESRPAGFSGGFQMAEAVGGYLSDFAYRNGIIDSSVTHYTPAMTGWSCFDVDEPGEIANTSVGLKSVTPEPYLMLFDGGDDCSDISVSVKIKSERTLHSVDVLCADTPGKPPICHGSDFIIKANQRNGFIISQQTMSRFTAGYRMSVLASLILTVKERIPGTGACGNAGPATAAKFGVYLGRTREIAPPRVCEL